jgi:hypothetical protein
MQLVPPLRMYPHGCELCIQVGWKLNLRGKVWGHHASDQVTRDWAKAHYNEEFPTDITGWDAQGEFTIQHGDEDAFYITYEHLWPYIPEHRRREILSMGGHHVETRPPQSRPAGRKPSPTLVAALAAKKASDAAENAELAAAAQSVDADGKQMAIAAKAAADEAAVEAAEAKSAAELAAMPKENRRPAKQRSAAQLPSAEPVRMRGRADQRAASAQQQRPTTVAARKSLDCAFFDSQYIIGIV